MSEDITRQPIIVNFSGAASANDEKAKVSSNDTTAGYLNGKLIAGTGIALTENTDAGDETLSIESTVTDTSDHDSLNNLIWSTAGHTMDTDLDMNSNAIKEVSEIWFDSDGDYKFVKNGTKIELWVQGTKVADWG